MSRLSKTQIYAIRWLESQKSTVPQIAKELILKDSQIASTIARHKKEIEVEVEKPSSAIKTKTSSTSHSKNLMITNTSSKQMKNVAIMTAEASQYNDATRQSRQAQTPKPNQKQHIFRPRNDD